MGTGQARLGGTDTPGRTVPRARAQEVTPQQRLEGAQNEPDRKNEDTVKGGKQEAMEVEDALRLETCSRNTTLAVVYGETGRTREDQRDAEGGRGWSRGDQPAPGSPGMCGGGGTAGRREGGGWTNQRWLRTWTVHGRGDTHPPETWESPVGRGAVPGGKGESLGNAGVIWDTKRHLENRWNTHTWSSGKAWGTHSYS